jgi:hypothetical protein
MAVTGNTVLLVAGIEGPAAYVWTLSSLRENIVEYCE